MVSNGTQLRLPLVDPRPEGESRHERLLRLLSGEPRLRLAANLPRRTFNDHAYAEATKLAKAVDAQLDRRDTS